MSAILALALSSVSAKADEMPSWEPGGTNPQTTEAGKWTAAAQPAVNPELTAAWEPLTEGQRFDKICWQKEGRLAILSRNLIAAPSGPTAQKSPATLVLFQPKQPGSYKVQIQGDLKVQTPPAGRAAATVFMLRDEGKTAEELALIPTADSHGETPGKAKLEFDKVIEFKAGDALALRVQTVNPGNATAGGSYLMLQAFTVEKAN